MVWKNEKRWWPIASLFSAVCVAIIVTEWIVVDRRYHPGRDELLNSAAMEEYFRRIDFSHVARKNRIPTGVFIQSLTFVASTKVNVSGIIWQRYPKRQFANVADEDLPIGFLLPESVDIGNTLYPPKLVYRVDYNDTEEVMGWYFESTLKQRFNYRTFPFDHKTVWIRFWNQDFSGQSRLIPDFAAYDPKAMSGIFGIDDDFVYGQWEMVDTFFDYKLNTFDTNLGLPGYGVQIGDRSPELYFNIVLRRKFINAFVINILPPLVVAVLLFATLLTVTNKPDRKDTFGFNVSGVIGVCSGLFFIVLLGHIQLRRDFAGSGLVYAETFYPLMYLALLGVAVDAYLFANPRHKEQLSLIYYQDNLIPKVLYWPLLLGTSTVISTIMLRPFDGLNSSISHDQSVVSSLESVLPTAFAITSVKLVATPISQPIHLGSILKFQPSDTKALLWLGQNWNDRKAIAWNPRQSAGS